MQLSATHRRALTLGGIAVVLVIVCSLLATSWYRSAAEQRRAEEADRAEQAARTPVDESTFDLCDLAVPSALPSLDWPESSSTVQPQGTIDRVVRWLPDVGEGSGEEECLREPSPHAKSSGDEPTPGDQFIRTALSPDLGWDAIDDAKAYEKVSKDIYVKRNNDGTMTALTRLPYYNLYVTAGFPKSGPQQEAELAGAVRSAKRKIPDPFRIPGRQLSGTCADVDENLITRLLGERALLIRSTDGEVHTSCAYAAQTGAMLTLDFNESSNVLAKPFANAKPAELDGFELRGDEDFFAARSTDGRKYLTAGTGHLVVDRPKERLTDVVNAALKARWGD